VPAKDKVVPVAGPDSFSPDSYREGAKSVTTVPAIAFFDQRSFSEVGSGG